jgi:hypothetical protein
MKPRRPATPLDRQAKHGFRGYPVATIAFYGPDARRASKVAVGIVDASGEAVRLERWLSETGDVRADRPIGLAIEAFIRREGARSVVMTDRIIGCPHEEGIDYTLGQSCPACPYWAGRDRFSGELLDERGGAPSSSEPVQVLGVAWYRPEQWSKLLEVADDRADLEQTHEAWEATARRTLAVLAQSGVWARKVEVDVDELVRWCRADGRAIDGAARAEFVERKLRQADDTQQERP